MLKLMEYAINTGIVKNKSAYFELIGFAYNSYKKVTDGVQSFTKEQIFNACKLTGASADWMFGFSDEMKRKPSKSAITRLEEIVIELKMK